CATDPGITVTTFLVDLNLDPFDSW
nr:immunoglobulin heavy chain junction region [Macaca mulatta]